MPVYVYKCIECTNKYSDEQLGAMSDDDVDQAVLFETFHSMEPSVDELAKAVICPRCNSSNCEKSIAGLQLTTYTRGFGWKDRDGARRDMNLYHLQNSDPYSKHRVPGEKDHIEQGLKKAGKHNSNSKVFVASRKPSTSE